MWEFLEAEWLALLVVLMVLIYPLIGAFRQSRPAPEPARAEDDRRVPRQ